MRIIFAGTPEFAVKSLSTLHQSEHDIVAVYCQPDRPKGRGKVMTACPVKIYAQQNNLRVIQPENFSSDANQKEIVLFDSDIMVVAAYGQILSKEALKIPKLGCLNIHASLLPRWRGAAPIERAILAGDKETGISIMQMNVGLDTGDVLLEEKYSISEFETSQTLTVNLANLGASSIIHALKNFSDLQAQPQNNNDATYAKKILKNEAQIDWNQSAETICNMIRAFNPKPIAQTIATSAQFENKVLRIIEAEVVNYKNNKSPGQIVELNKEICYVATGKGVINLKKVQLSGKKEISAKDFNNAYQLTKLQ